MNAEILCVGTELVLGDILNTNAQYLSKKLAQIGINVFYQSSVGDNPERIIKALSTAVTRSNLIIFTGGLGPTADDITIATVANALDIPLEKNEEAFQNIVKYFEISGKEMTDNNEKQAFLPKGCTVLPNDVGTAPGCVIEKGNQCIAFLPGVPHELERMFEKYLSKYLSKYSNGVILSKFLHIYGVGESKIDEKAKDFISGENPTVAPYAKMGETELRVTAKAKHKQDAEFLLNETTLTLSSMFGDSFYGYDDVTLESVVVNLLKTKGKTIATAESCTAGYISKRITDISGASKVFKMGVTTYSNESKTEELSVPADLIEIHGAVSREVAACMAKGIRLKSGADIGVSITGIAGPKSDESKKPVGLSYIGISDENGEYVIKSMKGPNKDREYIRYTSASEALNFVRLFLLGRLETLEIQEFKAVLLSEQQNEEPEEEIKVEETKPKNQKMPSYLIGIKDELEKEEEERQINLVAKEDAQQLTSKPKYNDKSTLDVNIKFDETEYTPVEAKEFEAFDAALEVYEKELVKEKQKGSFKNFFM
ncbi:MAG: competence/damage-inducible protein A [Clostridia bacterium]|nr:competence/damage-inducible protein A [Clostridia bacterium]